MILVLRYLIVMLLVGLGIYLLRRHFGFSSRGSRSSHELPPLPYCLNCESNRQVVENPGDRSEARWYCQRCREAF